MGLLRRRRGPITTETVTSRFKMDERIVIRSVTIVHTSAPKVLSAAEKCILRRSGSVTYAERFGMHRKRRRTTRRLGLVISYNKQIGGVDVDREICNHIATRVSVHSERSIGRFIRTVGDDRSDMLDDTASKCRCRLVRTSDRRELSLVKRRLGGTNFLTPLRP